MTDNNKHFGDCFNNGACREDITLDLASGLGNGRGLGFGNCGSCNYDDSGNDFGCSCSDYYDRGYYTDCGFGSGAGFEDGTGYGCGFGSGSCYEPHWKADSSDGSVA